MFYVYVHHRLDTGAPFYVGKGKGDRAYRHTSRNAHWKNIVSKVGEPVVRFLVEGVDEECSFLAEVEAIDVLKRRGVKLVNLTSGGDGATGLRRKQSPEEIERRRMANTGKKRTPEQCARIAAAKQGHGVGRVQSAEQIERRISPLRGKPRPDVAERFGGKKRPGHVIDALQRANDERYRARRELLTSAISANQSAGVMELVRLTGCDREMVGKYLRAARGVI